MKQNPTNFIFLLLLCSAPLSGQTPYLDSLRQVFVAEKDPHKKIDVYYEIATEESLDNPDKGFAYADTIEQMAKKARYKKGQGMSLHLRGFAHSDQGDTETAIALFNKELQLFQTLGARQEESNVYNNLGSMYDELGKSDTAILFYIKALKINEQTGDSLGSSIVHNNIGNIYSDNDLYDKAIEHFEKALAIRKSLGAEKRYIQCYSNLATVYARKKDFKKAQEYGTLGLELADKYGRKSNAGIICNNLGDDLYQQDRYAEALPWCEKALKYFRALNNEVYQTYPMSTLASCLGKMGQGEKALEYAEQGYEIVQRLGLDYQKEIYFKAFANAYEGMGDYKQALHWYREFAWIADSLAKVDNTEKVAELEVLYETEKKEAAIARERLQKNTVIFAALALVLLLLGFFQYFRNKQNIRRKEAELALQAKKSEAEKLRELDTLKSTFFANISHEFRTPLTLILGPVQQALDGAPSSSDPDEKTPVPVELHNLQLIRRSGLRLQSLVEQLLDLSRLDSGKMELRMRPGKLIAFIRSIVFSFESLAERNNIQLETAFPDEVKEAWFDADKWEKVLVNLLSNAFKFTPEGGTIRIECTEEDGHLRCAISDTGLGMPEKEAMRVFERFYQLEGTETQGSGIGLSLVKELIDLHQGTIRVESRPGAGSTFIFTLPFARELLPADAQWNSHPEKAVQKPITEALEPAQSMEQRPADTGKPLLLIVEDNADLRRYISESLEDQFSILSSTNGKAGLKASIEHTPDIVVSDVMMPEMDGFQLCEQLKSNPRTSHIPVVLLTAKAGQSHRLEGLETGADDYLTKPFDPKELLIRVQNLVKQRALLRERHEGEIVLKPSGIEANSVDKLFLEQVSTVIEENLDNEQFSVEDLAAALAFSRSQLYRKLKALSGKGPNELIRDFRLARAKELLEQGAGNVSEIALMVGYSSLAYFTQSFKQAFGVPPSEIR